MLLKKDVINRNNINDVIFLDNLIKYMSTCIDNLTTPNSISDFINKNDSNITNETVNSYLKMIENAYFIYRVPRYKLKGKQLLKIQGKYYFGNNRLKNILVDFLHMILEVVMKIKYILNFYVDGYEVYVGKYNDIEIDFIAIKPDERIYYQVSRSILNEKLRKEKKIFTCNKR